MKNKQLSKVVEEFVDRKKDALTKEEKRIAESLEELKSLESKEEDLERTVVKVVAGGESAVPEVKEFIVKLGSIVKSSLTEKVTETGKVIEKDKQNLPEGVLSRVVYPICNVGQLNANKRVYEKDLWDRVLNEVELKDKMQNRNLFGHAEHPEDVQSNLEKVSHIITKTWFDEPQNKVLQEMEVLDTPYGRIIDRLLRAGCKVGVSTRAEGELQEAQDEARGKYFKVLPETYRYVTTDFTAEPSTFGALPVKVERQCVDILQKGLEEKKIDEDFAKVMLENFKDEQAKVLLESIKAKEVKAQLQEEVEKGKALSLISEKDMGDIKKIFESEKPTDIRLYLFEHWNEFGTEKVAVSELRKKFDITEEVGIVQVSEAMKQFKGNPDSITVVLDSSQENATVTYSSGSSSVTVVESKLSAPVFESFEDLVKYLERELPKIDRENREKVKSLLNEGSNFKKGIDTSRLIKDLEISGAIIKAERDKALEIGDSLVLENSELVKKLGRLLVSEKVLEDAFGKLSVSDLSKNAEIGILNKKLLDITESQKKQLQELLEYHKQESVKLTEAFKKQELKVYYETRLSHTGLKLPKNALALLEHADSREQVDDLLEQFRDVLREGALHSNVLTEVSLPAQGDSQQAQIARSIHTVLNGMLGR